MAEDVCEEYKSSLADLTFNSKPHINMLTILAEENLQYATDIVKIIEAQIAKATTAEKLPILYLMDSIIKNVGKDYLSLFTQNIVSTFVITFEKVDENTRKNMFKLRSTWDTIFPLKKLYALDMRIHTLDPAWPVKPLPANVPAASIHVNPKFLNPPRSEEEVARKQVPTTDGVADQMRQELLAKKKQLLELQQKKLELELEQTKARLEVSAAVHNKNDVKLVSVAPFLSQHHSTTAVSARDPRLSNRDPRMNRNMLPISSVSRDHAAPTATLSVKPVAKIFASETLHSLQPQSQPGTFSNENLCDTMSSSGIMSHVSVRVSAEVNGPCNARAKESRRDDRDAGISEGGIDCGAKDDERRGRKGGNANRHLSPRRKVSLQSKSEAQDRQQGASRNRSHARSRSPLHRNLRHFTRATASGLHVKGTRSSLRSSDAHFGLPHHVGINTEVRNQGESSPSRLTSGSVDRRHVGSASTSQENSAGPSGVKGASNKRRVDNSPCRGAMSIGKGSSLLPLSRGEKVDLLENSINTRGKGMRNRLQHRKVRERCLEQLPSKEAPKEEQMAEAQFSPEPSGEDEEPPPDAHPHKRFRRSAWEQVKGIRQGQENVPPGGRDPLSGMVRRALTQAVRIQHRPSFDPDVQIPKEMALANKRDLLRKANQQLQSGSINEDQYLQMVHELNQIFRLQDETEGRRRSTLDTYSIKSFPFPDRKVCYLPSLSTGIGFGSFQPRAGPKHFPYHCATPVISQGDSPLQQPVSDGPLLPDSVLVRDPRMECLRIGSEGGQSPREGGGNAGEVGLRTVHAGVDSTDWKIHRGSPPFPGPDAASLERRRVLLKTPRDESLGIQSGTLGEGRGTGTRSRSPTQGLMDEVQVSHRAMRNQGVQGTSNFRWMGEEAGREDIQDEPLDPRPSRNPDQTSYELEPKPEPEVEQIPYYTRLRIDDPGPQDPTREQCLDLQHELISNMEPYPQQQFQQVPRHKELSEKVLMLHSGHPTFDKMHFERPDPHTRSHPPIFGPSGPMGSGISGNMPPQGPLNDRLKLDDNSDHSEGLNCNRLCEPQHEVPQFDAHAQRFDEPPFPRPLHSRLEITQIPQGKRFDSLQRHESEGPQGTEFGGPRFRGKRFGGHARGSRFGGPRFGGPRGPGFSGPQGPGFDGPRGAPKFDGPRGAPKFDGPRGAPRFDGPRGAPRFDGPRGTAGFDGPRGTAGFDGPRGAAGFDGPRGAAGFDGPRGAAGFDGPRGAMGFDGPRVAPGFDGPGGAPRFDGPGGAPRFDGPGGAPRFDGPGGAPRFDVPGGAPRFDVPGGAPRFDVPGGAPRFDVPGGAPRFDVPGGAPRFDVPGGPPRFDVPGGAPRFDVPGGAPRFDVPGGAPRFDVPGGAPRFDVPGGAPRFDLPGSAPRFDVPGGAPRFDGPVGAPRFDGPGGAPRFDGPGGAPRFDGPGGAPRFDGPGGAPRFDGPGGAPRFDGPGGAPRFDGPGGAPRFDGPGGAPRFDGPGGAPRFDGPGGAPRFPGPGGAPRFAGPGGAPRFDGPGGAPRFDGPGDAPRFDGPGGAPRFDGSVGAPMFHGPVGAAMFDGPTFEGAKSAQIAGSFDQQWGLRYDCPQFECHQGSRFDRPQSPCFRGSIVSLRQTLDVPTDVRSGHFEDGDFTSHQGPSFIEQHLERPIKRDEEPCRPPAVHSAPIELGPQMHLPNDHSHVQGPAESLVTETSAERPSQQTNHIGQLDINALYTKLLAVGIIGTQAAKEDADDVAETKEDVGVNESEAIVGGSESQSGKPKVKLEEEEEEETELDDDVPDISGFHLEELKQRYDCVITRLYTGIQCYSCGMRFTAAQTEVYADHLDWHYRMNRMDKDVTRKVTHRKWYYSITDWIEFEEIADLEERARSQFFEQVQEEITQRAQEPISEKEFLSVTAGPAGVEELCDICQEAFQQYWDEDEEEWHLKNAVRVDNKVYHPTCYEDHKRSSFDLTPTPIETPAEDPLKMALAALQDNVKEAESESEAESKEENPSLDDDDDDDDDASTPVPLDVEETCVKVE